MVDTRLLIAGAFAGSAYLTYHGFTEDSTLPTEVTGIIGMVATYTIYISSRASDRRGENIDILMGAIKKLKGGWKHDDLGWKAPEVPK